MKPSPCFGICSTHMGDNVCTGCRRTKNEVQNWQSLNDDQQMTAWKRLLDTGTAPERIIRRAQKHGIIDVPNNA